MFEKAREEKRLTNRAFANLIGINETAYSKLKKGELPLGQQTINKIKDNLPEYNLEWLLKGIEPKYSNLKPLSKSEERIVDKAVTQILKNNEPIAATFQSQPEIKPYSKLEAIPMRLVDPLGFNLRALFFLRSFQLPFQLSVAIPAGALKEILLNLFHFLIQTLYRLESFVFLLLSLLFFFFCCCR